MGSSFVNNNIIHSTGIVHNNSRSKIIIMIDDRILLA